MNKHTAKITDTVRGLVFYKSQAFYKSIPYRILKTLLDQNKTQTGKNIVAFSISKIYNCFCSLMLCRVISGRYMTEIYPD